MQHETFRNLESQADAFWYCLKKVDWYTCHYLMKPVPIPRNRDSFEILQLFATEV